MTQSVFAVLWLVSKYEEEGNPVVKGILKICKVPHRMDTYPTLLNNTLINYKRDHTVRSRNSLSV